jgi:hypothetical protein
MFEVWAILEGNKRIPADDVAVGADNTILALDSETPLLIRSCIILQYYALSLWCFLVQVITKETHFVCLSVTRPSYDAAFCQHHQS